MMAAPKTMPGAFMSSHDESSEFGRPFATPRFYASPSPSAASALSSSFQSISRASSSATIITRKRPRLDVSSHVARTPRRYQIRSGDPEVLSPAPLINTDYRIAGGLDKPSAEKVRSEDQNYFEHEKDHRLNRYNRQSCPTTDSYFPETPASNNAQFRKTPSSSPTSGWSKAVWDLTGGVAGKVINFCWNTAFHGFHVGGGRGFHMQSDTPTVTAADMGYVDTTEDVFNAQYRGRGTTPIPGGFPQENLIEDYMSHPASHQGDETPAQSNYLSGSSLRSDWVVVNEPYTDLERSPVRKKIRPSTANLHGRSVVRQSFASRPRSQGRASAGGASYASPRASGASLALGSRPPSSDGAERQHKRTHSSLASPRRSELGRSETPPKSPDVAKFEKKLRRQDHRQEESMRRMNEQMQDMMREVQQALASKVEVSEEVEDEGYSEGTDLPANTGW